jgi:hypothetical protein
MFHQIEGLVIDKGIHLGHLKWTLETFLKAFFERDDIVLRLRPSYFPFTEPSVEVDVGYTLVNGKRVVGGSGDAPGGGWMEVLGSGMVNRKVIEFGGLDPDEWQGFAFGTGVDRLAMLKYGLDDLRAFFDGDARWLGHYGFAALDVPTLSAVWSEAVKFSFVAQGPARHASERRRDCRKAHRLGLEIESVTDASAALKQFRVARVLTAEKHRRPTSSRCCRSIWVTAAAPGGLRRAQCARGLVGVLGLPGAVVPANGMELRKSAIRGVESNGMMCSTRELAWARSTTASSNCPKTPRWAVLCRLYRLRPGVRRGDHAPIAWAFMALPAIWRPLVSARCARSAWRGGGKALPGGHPHRGRGRLPGLLRPRDQGRAERPSPAMAARPPQGRRPAPDLGAGGHHQLCDARLWPPGPCL